MPEVEFQPFQRVLVRYDNQSHWSISLFGYKERSTYHCINGGYNQCIPYTDETAHLLGTTDSPTPPEAPFKWGDRVEVRTEGSWKKAIFLKKDNRELYFCVVEGGIAPSTWCGCRHADW